MRNGWQAIVLGSLRIDATLQLDEDARKAYSRHARRFMPVPVPSNVASFNDPPPPDMTGATSGKYFCQVQVYAPNSNSIAAVHPCSTPPKDYHAYLLVTYDDKTGRMRVWIKHMF